MIVGTATVEIHAVTSKVRGEIKRGMTDGMRGVGAEAGKEFDKGLQPQVDKSTTTTRSKLKSRMSQSGDESGRAWGERFKARVSSMGGGIGNLLRRSLGNEGSKSGDSFGKKFVTAVESHFKNASIKTKMLAGLTSFIGPALGLVGQLGGGLTAIATTAAQAAGALPGVYVGLSAIMSASLAAKLGLSGVSNALHVMNSQTATPAAIAAAMKGLTPAAKTFVQQLQKMHPLFTKLKQTASKNLLPGLAQGLKEVRPLFPLVNKAVGSLDKSIGNMAKSVGKMLAGPMKTTFASVLKNNSTIVRNLTKAATPFIASLLRIYHAIQPIVIEMSKAAQTGAKWLNSATKMSTANGSLAAYFQRSYDRAKQLFSIMSNLIKVVLNVAHAARSAGGTMLQSIDQVTGHWAKLTATTRVQNSMKQYFKDTVPVMSEVAGIIGDIGKDLVGLGQSNSLLPLLQQIRNGLLPALDKVLQATTGPVASTMVTLFTDIADAFAKISGGGQTGYLNTFLKTIDLVVKALDSLLSIPGVGPFVTAMASIAGAVAGLGFVLGKLRLLTFVKNLLGFGDAAATAAGGVAKLEGAKSAEKIAMDANNASVGKNITTYGTFGTKLKTLMTTIGSYAGAGGIGRMVGGAGEAGASGAIVSKLDSALAKIGLGGAAGKIVGGVKGLGLADVATLAIVPIAMQIANAGTGEAKVGGPGTIYAHTSTKHQDFLGGTYGTQNALTKAAFFQQFPALAALTNPRLFPTIFSAPHGTLGPTGLTARQQSQFGLMSNSKGGTGYSPQGLIRAITSVGTPVELAHLKQLAARFPEIAKNIPKVTGAAEKLAGVNARMVLGMQRVNKAGDNVRTSLTAMGAVALSVGSKDLKGNSNAAVANRQALTDAARSVKQYRQSMVNAGVPISQVKQRTAEYAKELRQNAIDVYGNKKAVDALLKSLGATGPQLNKLTGQQSQSATALRQYRNALIQSGVSVSDVKDRVAAFAQTLGHLPPSVATRIIANTSQAASQVKALTDQVHNIAGKTYTYNVDEQHHITIIGGGTPTKPTKHRMGGLIRGRGTGTSDSNVIAVSNEEFVVNARATRRNRSLLERINWEGIRGYATGGHTGKGGANTVLTRGGGALSSTLQTNLQTRQQSLQSVFQGLISALTQAIDTSVGAIRRESKQLSNTITTRAHALAQFYRQHGMAGEAKQTIHDEHAALKVLQDDTDKMDHLATRRASITKRLTNAQQTVSNLLQARAQLRGSIRSGIGGYSDVTQIVPQGVAVTGSRIATNLQYRLSMIRKWSANIRTLIHRGVSRTIIKDIIAQGPDTGGPYAQALVNATPAQLRTIDQTESKIEDISRSTAKYVGNQFYKNGITAAQGLVDGLKSKLHDVDKAARKLGKKIADAMKHELGIHSPSKVGLAIGANIPHSVSLGINRAIPLAENAASRMASRVAAASGQINGDWLARVTAASGAGAGSINSPLLHVEHLHINDQSDITELERMLYRASQNTLRATGKARPIMPGAVT